MQFRSVNVVPHSITPVLISSKIRTTQTILFLFYVIKLQLVEQQEGTFKSGILNVPNAVLYFKECTEFEI
jgi:hypothetical protein